MINQQLLDYIRQQSQQGASQEKIKSMLIANGWLESDVNEAFGSVVGTSSHQPQIPMPQQATASLPSATALLGQAWTIYKQRLTIFAGIMVIPMIMMLIMSGLSVFLSDTERVKSFFTFFPSEFTGAGFWLLIIVTILFFLALLIGNLWGQMALLYAIRDSSEGIGIKESYRRGWHKIASYLWISILAAFITLGGFLLLIVPGIIFAIWFSLAMFVLVSEDLKGMNALLRSKEYVKGHWGGVWWRLIFISGLNIVIYIIPAIILGLIKIPFGEQISQFVVGLLLGPLATIYLFLVYSNLKSIKGEVAFVPARSKRLTYIFIAVLGLLLIPAMFFVITFASLNSTRYKARDAKREADLRFLRTALDLYLDDRGGYPLALNELTPQYLTALPVDPKTNIPYFYERQGETDYKICAQLENRTEKCFSSTLLLQDIE